LTLRASIPLLSYRRWAGPVRLIHPSFHDFLIDSDRCNDINSVINAPSGIPLLLSIAAAILQTLSPTCANRDPSISKPGGHWFGSHELLVNGRCDHLPTCHVQDVLVRHLIPQSNGLSNNSGENRMWYWYPPPTDSQPP